jgi:hypothetical protein
VVQIDLGESFGGEHALGVEAFGVIAHSPSRNLTDE